MVTSKRKSTVSGKRLAVFRTFEGESRFEFDAVEDIRAELSRG